jgi:drug/metabolite transporter (DMT)-like permease
MSGPVWATLAGVGFGLFQSLNRQAIRGMDVWQSTFLQLSVSTVILLAATLATDDAGMVWSASHGALVAFLAAGLVHFFLGWTLLNVSQKRIGAARTSPLLAATPLFGTILAAVTLGEVPGVVTVAGMLLIMAGVYVTLGSGGAGRAGGGARAAGADSAGGPDSAGGGGPGAARASGRGSRGRIGGKLAGWSDSLPGLGTAACWAVSPLLIRQGLKTLPSPLVGVTFSMFGATLPQGLVVALRRRRGLSRPMAWEATSTKLAAAVLVGLSTWSRWVALDRSPVAVVLALGLLSVPTVMLVAPPLAGRHEELVTARVWLGAALVVGGSLLLVLRA